MDGGTSKISDGDQLRIPKRTVSYQGTVSTVGFEVVQAGLDVFVGIRDLGACRAKMKVNVSLSEVVGYLEGLSQINNQAYETEAVIRSSGVYSWV